MNIKNLIKAALLTSAAACFMAGGAKAGTVTYSTNDPATGFNSASLNTLASTSGQSATLQYLDNVNSTTGVPSNVNFGSFTLACPTCTTQNAATPLGSFFGAFTFDLIITDVGTGARGQFTGTSTGGEIFSDVSPMTITWVPGQLGPGTLNAIGAGDFGLDIFTKQALTNIVAPNSGETPGLTTVQGAVDTAATPEPATSFLLGGALLGLGFFGRRRLARK